MKLRSDIAELEGSEVVQQYIEASVTEATARPAFDDLDVRFIKWLTTEPAEKADTVDILHGMASTMRKAEAMTNTELSEAVLNGPWAKYDIHSMESALIGELVRRFEASVPEMVQPYPGEGWELCERDEAEEYCHRPLQWLGHWSDWELMPDAERNNNTEYLYRRRVRDWRPSKHWFIQWINSIDTRFQEIQSRIAKLEDELTIERDCGKVDQMRWERCERRLDKLEGKEDGE